MKKRKPICLIDQDQTLADLYTSLVDELCSRYGLDLDPKKYNEYFGDYTIKHPEIERQMIDTIFSSDEFFRCLSVMPGARTAVKRLKKNFDLYILTKPWMKAHNPYLDKLDWIQRNFPVLADRMIPTSHKQMVYGDIFIDDHMPNLVKWKSFWNDHRNIRVPHPLRTASLKYSWTNEDEVDIVGDNWTDLVNKIEEEFFGKRRT